MPKRGMGSWLVTGRRTYYDLVAARVTDQDFPGFADLQARGIPTAVVSLPCWELFDAQDAAYRREVLGNLVKRFWLESQGATGINLERIDALEVLA